jgi:hypothetical protein
MIIKMHLVWKKTILENNKLIENLHLKNNGIYTREQNVIDHQFLVDFIGVKFTRQQMQNNIKSEYINVATVKLNLKRLNPVSNDVASIEYK